MRVYYSSTPNKDGEYSIAKLVYIASLHLNPISNITEPGTYVDLSASLNVEKCIDMIRTFQKYDINGRAKYYVLMTGPGNTPEVQPPREGWEPAPVPETRLEE